MVGNTARNPQLGGPATEVLLVRHGETYANACHFYNATGAPPVDEHVNPPVGQNMDDLNPIGVAQSRVLADALAGPKIQQMWSSPARRALDTLTRLLAQLQVASPVIQTFDELDELQVTADEYAFLATGSMSQAPHDLQARVKTFRQRLSPVRQRIADLTTGTRVLVVAHAATNAGLLAGWDALPDQRWPTLANGSLSTLRFDRHGRLRSAVLGQIDHQPESLRRNWSQPKNDSPASELLK